MVIVIIAGGQGTRLWPLSKPDYPKHLLSLVNENSLLQNTLDRVKPLSDQIYAVPETSHVAEVKKQIPSLQLIEEPARRGTAHCILLALAQLSKKYAKDEVVAFLHADSHITDETAFRETVEAAAQATQELKKIVLVGVQPDYPATGFGYIKTGKEIVSEFGQPVLSVEKFVEKPDEKTARSYLKSKQYLWNLGLFAGTIESFEREIQTVNKDLWKSYQQLCKKSDAELKQYYLSLSNEAIDTALIEKIPDLAVVPGHFDWADIGSFRDLHEILRNGSSNVHKGKVYDLNSTDSLVLAGDKPIVTIGLKDMIVVDTPEGILVCPKDQCQLVKEGVALLDKSSQK